MSNPNSITSIFTRILLASTLAILFVGITDNMMIVYASEDPKAKAIEECKKKFLIGSEEFRGCLQEIPHIDPS
jgi:hypothetical protein